METPNLTNKQFTKEAFHNELMDYLQHCPAKEREAGMQFLETLYSINIHTLCTGDAVDILIDSTDIRTDDIGKVSLVNFLITTQIRMRHTFNDMDSLMDNHLSTLTNMVSGIGFNHNNSTRIANSKMLKYIVLIRIYLDLKLMSTVQEHDRDNSI